MRSICVAAAHSFCPNSPTSRERPLKPMKMKWVEASAAAKRPKKRMRQQEIPQNGKT